MNVTSLISATAEVVREIEPPADPDEALALVAAAVEADQELMAMCNRIANQHNAVREQWRSFDPAGRPLPGGEPGCLSALFSPRLWFRVLRSLATAFPGPGGSEAGGSSVSPDPVETASAPGNPGSDG